ncbi:tRNA uridine-5-carboxymethylaminomethyl(34) synthesis GTPase MnmE [Frigidibacter albus]|uniref:tRNA modification GTPase MnmE n=1 Tax=Frigidibacter albus TaxID=1465486 RepID=A0A6L8VK40_9RHOB|nr:tRNA uridine-5-carboxymethylaminomethyl(34) synthesis GTPase MnmE [Frigidibacter albus]MZQ89550.1 tRNA uridine-5-carboxymethylaminomethyl(34) synthesis GTPase MnmE [Frigidibacter albus]NBE31456.1 tRNA uridine-5-carboxymethylaminomethyl(34) synthesis GTPase MnmE [Frigidibacter albus]GGH55372.1 tRNA modification GTPase MnmE [Frigidibacter albus]
MDTIFALASARGRAGVAVIRISGPLAWDVARDLAGGVPEPRVASLRVLRDGAEVLDHALVLCFAAGASFTGEEVAELHLHGSTATVAAVLRVLGDRPGLRMAEAGEFTRRALENGCLDLAQVEGLSDMIEAETEAQRKQAMRVLSGAVGARAEGWRRQLIRAAALIEATIDFADEDVPVDVTPEVTALLEAVVADLRAEAEGAKVSERIRDGFEVAIVGLPNAGKSTLLNALAGREAAITSEHAGTTRDVIEVRMDLAGLPVTILDTAGLRETEDAVEAIGVERALTRARAADLRVFLIAEDGLPEGLEPLPEDIVLRGKADAGGGVSGKTGAGVAELIARVTSILEARAAGAAVVTRERHRLAILRAVTALESARVEVLNGADRAELAAEDMRHAIRALDSLVGRVDVEHLLGEIFASFCIGK